MRAMSFGSLLFSCSVISVLSMNSFATAADGADRLPGDHGRMAGGVLPSRATPSRRTFDDATQQCTSAGDCAGRRGRSGHNGRVQAIRNTGHRRGQCRRRAILVYVPDGSEPSHGYTAIRKAYTAAKLKTDTTALVEKAQKDSDFAATIKADPNLMAFHGGLLLQVGGEVIGAIGVSGAEPGGHDDECGMIGLNKIKDRLK